MPNAHTNNITAIITVAKITIHGMLYTANITFRIKDKLSTIKLFKKKNKNYYYYCPSHFDK